VDVEARLQKHEDRLDSTEKQLAILHESRNNLERLIQQHDEDIGRIKVMQANMATKDDIHDVSQKIDESVNGLLKDALNSVPIRHANNINFWLLIVTAVGVLVAFLAIHYGH